MKLLSIFSLSLTVMAGISLFSPAFAVVSIDYVSIGNAGNTNDAATGGVYGAVSYAYNISKNETTISQYAEFLNAVAKTDSYGLYSASMAGDTYVSRIIQSGLSGSFTYSVTSGSENKPITYVSWFDAARFCNWLQNGQQTGAGADLTAETGAYTLNGATSGIITKNGGATVWIPTESEWYKAAYYDPNKGGAGGYWVHATQSDTLAGNTIGVTGSANYNDGDYVGSGTSEQPTGNALTDVGAYGENSNSAYGTNDQAGNVWEWNDAVSDSKRGLRGGSWGNFGDIHLASSNPNVLDPSHEDHGLGFRVASIPEPSAIILTILFSASLVTRRRR